MALLSAMDGMFAGISHAFALIRKEDIDPVAFAPLLADWLVAMTPSVHTVAAQLADGDYTREVVSSLAMQVAGNATLLRTAEEQGVSAELLTPYMALMERLLADGRGDEHHGCGRPAGTLTAPTRDRNRRTAPKCSHVTAAPLTWRISPVRFRHAPSRPIPSPSPSPTGVPTVRRWWVHGYGSRGG